MPRKDQPRKRPVADPLPTLFKAIEQTVDTEAWAQAEKRLRYELLSRGTPDESKQAQLARKLAATSFADLAKQIDDAVLVKTIVNSTRREVAQIVEGAAHQIGAGRTWSDFEGMFVDPARAMRPKPQFAEAWYACVHAAQEMEGQAAVPLVAVDRELFRRARSDLSICQMLGHDMAFREKGAARERLRSAGYFGGDREIPATVDPGEWQPAGDGHEWRSLAREGDLESISRRRRKLKLKLP